MTAYPPMSFTDIIEYQPRPAEPHVWMLPAKPTPHEFDVDALIATYQQTTRDTLAAMRYDTPRLTAISVLFDIVTAIREKYSRE